MASAFEHAEIIFSGVLPNRKDRLDKVMRRLTSEHFTEIRHANFFKMLEKYNDQVNAVVPRKYLDDLLKDNIAESQHLLYMEMYDTYASNVIDDSEFTWSINQLRTLATEKATGNAIAEAMEILRTGKEITPGKVLTGHEDARARLLESISYIEREMEQIDSPEGLIQDEKIEILEEYTESKRKRESGEVQGVGFGIEQLDDITGGMQRGDLVIIAASSSNGKSSVATQAAWYAATQQGENAIFFATETGRAIIRRKMIARHSKLEMFGLPDGLDTRSIKDGTLTPKEEQIFQDVVHDLTSNPNYGKIHLAQIPRGSTINHLEHAINRLSKSFDPGLVVMDYLALLSSITKTDSERSKYVDILREAKMVANSVADGLGVPFISPWQMKREGRSEADTTGYYTMRDLADTAEAERIADIIVSIYKDDSETGRYVNANMQILKHRDGSQYHDIPVYVDYATSTFQSTPGLQMPRAMTEKTMNSELGLAGLY